MVAAEEVMAPFRRTARGKMATARVTAPLRITARGKMLALAAGPATSTLLRRQPRRRCYTLRSYLYSDVQKVTGEAPPASLQP